MSRKHNAIQPIAISAVETIALGFGFTYSKFPHAPHSLGNGGLFDFAAHATNVWGTALFDTAVTSLGLHKDLFNSIPRAKAVHIAAATLAVGAAINAAIETPSSAHYLGSHIPRLQGTADWRDELYGDMADVLTVGTLYAAMRYRHQKGEEPFAITPTQISYDDTILSAPLTFVTPSTETQEL